MCFGLETATRGSQAPGARGSFVDCARTVRSSPSSLPLCAGSSMPYFPLFVLRLLPFSGTPVQTSRLMAVTFQVRCILLFPWAASLVETLWWRLIRPPGCWSVSLRSFWARHFVTGLNTWQGSRDVLVAYSPNHFEELSHTDQQALVRLGFRPPAASPDNKLAMGPVPKIASPLPRQEPLCAAIPCAPDAGDRFTRAASQATQALFLEMCAGGGALVQGHGSVIWIESVCAL